MAGEVLWTAEMSVMVRSLSDDTGLFFIRISGFSDTFYATDEVYYVVDLRPTEFTITVETECFFNC